MLSTISHSTSRSAAIVREIDRDNTLADLEPIDVARGLIAIYDDLPPWVGRTGRLSANAKRIRDLFKRASDPNRLIFDQIPQLMSEGPEDEPELHSITGIVREGLLELQGAYPEMLERLQGVLLGELQVPNRSPAMMDELQDRAKNIRDMAGDHRIEAFLLRLSQFTGTPADVENLASMAANKPVPNWVDNDIDRATVEIAGMSQQFLKLESLAHVKGRADRRHAVAVTVGIGGRPYTMHKEFDVTSPERADVEILAEQLRSTLAGKKTDNANLVLAALAEVSAEYLKEVPHQGKFEL